MSHPSSKLSLPQVTLCAATSVNLHATVRALAACLAQIDFADCMLFTDAAVEPAHPGIRVVPIDPLDSSAAYSHFLLTGMVDHVEASHCLVVQWDGHVLDAARWLPEFLDHDYIGASWPQFDGGHDIGNGGFSLRSRRLMTLCRHPEFRPSHPEDIAIGRVNRAWLESNGVRFAPRELADRFAAERAGDPAKSFGYHGVWHMPQLLGAAAFWDIYRGLDDRGTIRHDFASIAGHVVRGPSGLRHLARLLGDHAVHRLRARVPRLPIP